MKIITTTLLVLLLYVCNYSIAQQIPAHRLTDWATAGYNDTLPDYGNVVNVMNHGAKADGVTPDDAAFTAAMNALNGQPGTIYFPAGDYLFNQQMLIDRDSVIVKGDGVSTRLLFDMGGTILDMIDIRGTHTGTTYDLTQAIQRGDASLALTSSAGLKAGDYLFLSDLDTGLVYSSWAEGLTGQIVRVKSNNSSTNTVALDMGLRRNYDKVASTNVKLIEPVQGVGIECLYIERKDATTQQANNLSFHTAAYCWAAGVESNMSNFAHVSVTYSSHILVRGCYFHDAHGYGEGGQAYGVNMQYASGDCLVENNIFEHLRHSMLVQAGANGNVFAYNYSTNAFWHQAPFPNDAAGDIVCHGNYPYLNLFEGNICQNIVIDDSHGINGPYNTFFRNRAQLYGIYTNANIPTDSVNYIGNEVTNKDNFKGNYTLNGKGHFEHGNNIKTVITPAGTKGIAKQSMYLNGTPGYWLWYNSYPSVGEEQLYNTGNNTASSRYSTAKTDCERNPIYTSVAEVSMQQTAITIAPNPVHNELRISLDGQGSFSYSIYNVTGKLILTGNAAHGSVQVPTASLTPGVYVARVLQENGSSNKQKFIKL